jgi:hypothetical protein
VTGKLARRYHPPMSRSVVVVALAALVVACRTAPNVPPDAGPADADQPAMDASATAEVDPASAIAAFAAAHGVRHAGPFEVPGSKWLFFVGGDVAHGGWLASTPSPGAKPSFEAVDLPRAVRVVDVVVQDAAAYILLESVAALDQPAGLTAVIVLGKDAVPWSLADARSASELRARLARRASLPPDWNDTERFKRAAKSPKAFDALIGPDGLDVYEIWQSTLVRRLEHLDREGLTASPNKDALLDLANRLGSVFTTCDDERALCLIGHTGDMSNDEGAHLSSAGGKVQVRSLFLARSAPSASPEPPPAVAGGDALVAAWRFSHDAAGAPRVLAQADLGGGRVFGVLGDGKDVWIVEREGGFSRVAKVLPAADLGASPTAGAAVYPEGRIVDLDGDGVAEIVIWDARVGVPRAWVYRRSRSISDWPLRDGFGVEVGMLGAPTLDEALRAASAPVERVRPTNMQVCVLAAKASTAQGFRSLAAPGARVVVRRDAFTNGSLARVVPAADVKDADVESLHCDGGRVVGCFAEKRLLGLCSLGPDETQTVNPMIRFVRIGGAIKIDVVSVFGE